MSYRIYVNKVQVLGNNECPKVLIEELKRQGAIIDEDFGFRNFKIKDLQGIIDALETYIRDTYKSLKDYKKIEDCILESEHLTFQARYSIMCCYIFVTYNFLEAIKGNYTYKYDPESDKFIYELKADSNVIMEGF